MKVKNHLVIAVTAICGWGAFYLTGIPSHYYVDWSSAEKILFLWLGVLCLFPFICIMLIAFLDGDFLKIGIWSACYASLIPFVLDFLVVGVFEHRGLHFIVTHWPQSIGYLEPWISMPPTALAIEKILKRVSKYQ